jgi:hypothetical protein
MGSSQIVVLCRRHWEQNRGQRPPNALTVQDSHTCVGIAAHALPLRAAHGIKAQAPQAVEAQSSEMAAHRLPRWEVGLAAAPGGASTRHIEDGSRIRHKRCMRGLPRVDRGGGWRWTQVHSASVRSLGYVVVLTASNVHRLRLDALQPWVYNPATLTRGQHDTHGFPYSWATQASATRGSHWSGRDAHPRVHGRSVWVLIVARITSSRSSSLG